MPPQLSCPSSKFVTDTLFCIASSKPQAAASQSRLQHDYAQHIFTRCLKQALCGPIKPTGQSRAPQDGAC